MTTDEIMAEVNRLCPGDAYHAKSQMEAEYVANMMMDYIVELVEKIESAQGVVKELMFYLDEDYQDGKGLMTPGYRKAIEGVKEIVG